MAINQLQISPYAAPVSLDFSPLGRLGEVYREGVNRQKLTDLGQDLASGTVDYRQAAGRAADLGDIGSTLKFLALAEQRKKQEDELAADTQFRASITGFRPQETTIPVVPPRAAPPSVGVPNVTPPSVSPRAPVASTPSVWGDDEAVSAGLYEPPAKGVQLAQNGSAKTATDAGPQVAPRAPAVGGGPPPLPGTITQNPVAGQDVTSLLSAMSNPRLSQNSRETAKLLLTNALESGRLTNDQKEYVGYWQQERAAGRIPEEFTPWQRANKTAAAQSITVDQRGENAEAKSAGEAAGKRRAEMFASSAASSKNLTNLARMETLLNQVSQGKVSPAAMTVSAWAKSFGLNDEVATSLGLDPKGVGSAQALQSLVNESVIGKIGAGGFPANNFSNPDREFLVEIYPRLGDDPVANRIRIEGARRMEHLAVQRAKDYTNWKKDAANKGKGFEDFELEWADKMASRDLFGDLRREAESIVGKPRPDIGGTLNNPGPAPQAPKPGGRSSTGGFNWSVQ